MFRIRPCIHAVSLIPLPLVWTFVKPVYIYLSIYMGGPADPTRRAQLRRPVAVANLLGLALFQHVLVASHVGFPVDLSLTYSFCCAKYILTFNFCCLARCWKPSLYLLLNKWNICMVNLTYLLTYFLTCLLTYLLTYLLEFVNHNKTKTRHQSSFKLSLELKYLDFNATLTTIVETYCLYGAVWNSVIL